MSVNDFVSWLFSGPFGVLTVLVFCIAGASVGLVLWMRDVKDSKLGFDFLSVAGLALFLMSAASVIHVFYELSVA